MDNKKNVEKINKLALRTSFSLTKISSSSTLSLEPQIIIINYQLLYIKTCHNNHRFLHWLAFVLLLILLYKMKKEQLQPIGVQMRIEEEKEIQIISSTTEPPPKYTANDSDCLSFAINFE